MTTETGSLGETVSTGPDFWSDLRDVLAEMDCQMTEFLDDYRGLWPKIEVDIEKNPELREMLTLALAIKGVKL